MYFILFEMTNLLLLKDLLPEEYKVLGSPSKILIISPFKTPFGYIETVVEDFDNHFEIFNTDIPYQLELIGLTHALKNFKSYTSLAVKIEKDRIVVRVPKKNNLSDLINLAKAVDNFIKDLYDFLQNLSKFPEVREKLGVVDHLVFKFETLQKQKEHKLNQQAENLKAEIIDTYTDLKGIVSTLNSLVEKRKFKDAEELLHQALERLAYLDRLRNEYHKLTGKDSYAFHADLIRSYIFQIKETLEQISEN